MLQLLRNMKVSTKLITVLAAPVIVLIVLAALGFTARTSESDEARRVEELAGFIAFGSELMDELQREALWSGASMALLDDSLQRDPALTDQYRAQIAVQRAATDEARSAFERSLADVDPGHESPTVAEAVLNGETRLGRLPTLRSSVDSIIQTPLQVTEEYANLSSSVAAINASLVQTATDPDLLLGLTTVANFERLKNAKANEGTILTQIAVRGAFVTADGSRCDTVASESCVSWAAALTAANEVTQAEETFNRFASTDEKQELRTLSTTLPLDAIRRQMFDQGQNGNTVTIDRAEVIEATDLTITQLATLDTQFIGGVEGTAGSLASDSDNAARLYLLLTLLAVAAALTVAFLVARATTVPLRKLTNAAYTLSTDRLPGLVERLRNPEEADKPLSATLTRIDIESKDEVGRLADAFNSIQQVTVEVAEEQAQLLRKGIGDIFINLARRNQTLLDRQIEFIDQLEANEEDPDQLDNLFKLDHLATRMRRNAESLLVLAGAEPPRRRGRPVALADVVRVAIGEVEDFARIQLLALDEATVAGNVAVDLAHLLSELMENATHFSPPDTTVEIVGHRSEDGTYVLSVSDQGIGMSADQLAEANSQLARPPLVGLAMSRSLGFIVIGRLSGRFDIAVKLTASPSGGVTALVSLPAALVTYPGEEVAPGADQLPAAGEAVAELAPAGGATDVESLADLPVFDLPTLDEEPLDSPEPAFDGPAFDENVFDTVVFDDALVDEAPAPPADEIPAGDQPTFHPEPLLERRRPPEPVVDEPAPPLPVVDEPAAFDDEPVFVDLPGVELDSPATNGSDQSVTNLLGDGDDDLLDELVEEVVPEGDDFERGLKSLVEDELSPGLVEEPSGLGSDRDEPSVAGAFGPASTLDEALPPVVDAPSDDLLADGLGAAAPMQQRVPKVAGPGVEATPTKSEADMTAAGLVRRTPKKRSTHATGGGMPTMAPTRQASASQRSPEEVRKMLSRYRSGLNKGRGNADSEGRS